MGHIANTPGVQPIKNTSTVLISTNPTFDYGQIIFETDTNRTKIGDGATAYTSLTYPDSQYEEVEAAGTDTYTGNLGKPFFLAYFKYMRIRVKFTNANTGAATINLNGYGAVAIRKNVSTALVAADIIAGGIYELVYDGTNFQMITSAGSISGITIPLPLSQGGTNANLTASIGGIFYSTATAGAILAGTATAGQMLRSGASAAPTWSTNTWANTTGVGQILYATAANVISSNTDFVRLTTGEFIVGATALISTEFISFQKNQNAFTGVFVSNTTSGTAGRAGFAALTNAGLGFSLNAYSPAFTTSGIQEASTAVIISNQLSGLNIGTTSNTQLSFWTNNTRRASFLNSGELIWGATALISTEKVLIKTDANALTHLRVNNATAGTAAGAAVVIQGSGVGALAIYALSSSYTTAGMLVQDGCSIVSPSTASGGLNIGTQGANTLQFWTNDTKQWSITSGGILTAEEAKDIAFGTATGTKIGTATSQKIGVWNATPIVQPTTAIAAATFVTNTSLIANDTATWDGYTIGQVVKALRNTGLLA